MNSIENRLVERIRKQDLRIRGKAIDRDQMQLEIAVARQYNINAYVRITMYRRSIP